MENIEIAKIFHDIADLLEIKNENPFRVRSYRTAARIIEELPENLKSIVERDESQLEDIRGIGKSIHEKIVEIVRTGKCRFHEELLKQLPPTLLELLDVSGIGPKKVQLLYKELGIQSVSDLEKAAKGHKIHELTGMGEKTEENILKAIENFKAGKGRFKLGLAMTYAAPLLEYLKEIDGVLQVSEAGSLRRRKETIGDIDILVACKKGSPVMDRFTAYTEVKDVLAKGDTKSTVILRCGLQADVRVLDKKSYGAALQYFTGSKAHNIAIRDRAKKMGLKLSEYGVFDEKDRFVAGETEGDVYKAVGLVCIPPELRENTGEIESALNNKLPHLIDVKDIKGDLHVHTVETDGANTIDEIIDAAIKMDYEYIAITDHSKAVSVAHGLDEKRVLKQIEEIDKLNKRLTAHGLRLTVLKGIEVDIKVDGSLDLDKDVLKRLDVVVGAVHSRFNMAEEEMTARIIKAISSGLVHIIAHPTGRLINERQPYAVNMTEIMKSCKKHNVILELNSYPDRLDLNDIHCKLAKEMGVLVAISTDSHSKFHLDNIRFGIYTARRGWLEKKDVLNTRPLKEVMQILKKIIG
ncbi:MAG: DNA polymerase/3'-5' exonuclease PolX [Deltaproteobacteria bacterium]|nr:DNA polymerase/3'-5' exonuclease PolX [Deltaproteobacteria bacterium]